MDGLALRKHVGMLLVARLAWSQPEEHRVSAMLHSIKWDACHRRYITAWVIGHTIVALCSLWLSGRQSAM